jgi:thiamine biosynthesis lipoprotein
VLHAIRPALACVVLFATCSTPQRFEFEAPAMGTLFRIVVYADSAGAAEVAAQAGFERVRELDRCMSDYLESSELSALSRSAGSGRAVECSADLWNVLVRAQQFAEASQGAFDVSAGSVVELWRRARRQGELPRPERVAAALESAGWVCLELDREQRTARLTRKGMQLDLGGIAKGFAVDAALDVLAEHGLERALVVGGGDVGAREPAPGARGWRVAVAPFDDPRASFELELRNAAVSTSGDRAQSFEVDGRRYSHIVDPRTGQALSSRVSATVIAADSTTADALATALCVLGDAEGLAWAQRHGALAARISREGPSAFECASTPGFERLMLAPPARPDLPADHRP